MTKCTQAMPGRSRPGIHLIPAGTAWHKLHFGFKRFLQQTMFPWSGKNRRSQLDENEEVRLVRVDSKKTQQKTIMEHLIEPADTLLSLSIRFNVPIAELKRVNNILTEQGFYGLRLLKVPVQPFSLLLPEGHITAEGGWLPQNKELQVVARGKETTSHLEEVMVEQMPLLPHRRVERVGRCSNHTMVRVYSACMIAGLIGFVVIVISWRNRDKEE